MKNQPYVKQFDMDLDMSNPNYGKPILLNPITKENPFHNNTFFNRRLRNENTFINIKGEIEIEYRRNNRTSTKGRKVYRQLKYSFSS